jgi:hypothetical protein
LPGVCARTLHRASGLAHLTAVTLDDGDEEECRVARVTLIFAFLMVVLGEAGYLGTGSVHKTALIPVWFGLALGLFGFLALRAKSEKGRMTLMHINVTIGLLGFLGAAVEAVRGYMSANAQGHGPDMIALASKLTMAVLMGIYVAMCVRSFIAARRARQA